MPEDLIQVDFDTFSRHVFRPRLKAAYGLPLQTKSKRAPSDSQRMGPKWPILTLFNAILSHSEGRQRAPFIKRSGCLLTLLLGSPPRIRPLLQAGELQLPGHYERAMVARPIRAGRHPAGYASQGKIDKSIHVIDFSIGFVAFGVWPKDPVHDAVGWFEVRRGDGEIVRFLKKREHIDRFVNGSRGQVLGRELDGIAGAAHDLRLADAHFREIEIISGAGKWNDLGPPAVIRMIDALAPESRTAFNLFDLNRGPYDRIDEKWRDAI